MTDFHEARTVLGRRAYRCQQCRKEIEAKTQHVHAVGKYDGEFYSNRLHIECEAAGHAYATLHHLWGDEYPWFAEYPDFEFGDWEWMVENFPIVAVRLGWDEKLSQWRKETAVESAQ